MSNLPSPLISHLHAEVVVAVEPVAAEEARGAVAAPGHVVSPRTCSFEGSPTTDPPLPAAPKEVKLPTLVDCGLVVPLVPSQA